MSFPNKSANEDYSDYYYIDDPLPTVPVEIIPPCNPMIFNDFYHGSIVFMSVLMLIFLHLAVKRKRLCQDCWGGVPGLLSTVNFLEGDGHRGAASAVYSLVFCSICRVVLGHDPIPFIRDTPKDIKVCKEYWKILALLYYPIVYYVLLACETVKSIVGYIMGVFVSCTSFGFLIWQRVQCPKTPEIYKYYSLLSSLPQMVCLGYLSCLYIYLLVRNCNWFGTKEKTEIPGSNYYKEYVRNLLKKKSVTLVIDLKSVVTVSSRIVAFLHSFIYIPQKGFQVPVQVAISVTVAIIAVYQVALLLVARVVPTLQKARAGVTEDIAFVLTGFNIELSQDRAEVADLVRYYFWVIEVCYVSAIVLSCLATISMIMRSMVMHSRANLKALYRGDVLGVFGRRRKLQPSRLALTCWMAFTSYQSALVCLGFLVQQLVFFICTLFVGFLIIIPILYGRNLILFYLFKSMWPFWLGLVLALLSQNLLAQFAFLEKQESCLEITNRYRRALYISTYLFFAYNVLLGVLMGVWRMIFTALFNIVHLCRLDLSLLNRGVESFDPGYRCYYNFLKIEVSQAHPVMKAACCLLACFPNHGRNPVQEASDAEEGIQLVLTDRKPMTVASIKRAKARWWLAYTLVMNPSLAACRK
uniref:Receptor for retinol uptake STRA6 n=1 Tax=Latimeria chalumnae TaxID=7897 RepID=H3AAE8_LATCH